MMQWLKRTWFVWLSLGIVSALVAPRLIDAGAARRQPPATPAQAVAPRFVVRDPSGTAIGWLNIKYPRTIRENEEGVLEAEYTTGDARWKAGSTSVAVPDPYGYGSVQPPAGMKVELSGADLALTPTPTHAFDVQRIAATGVERVKWIVSPKTEGDHVLLVRFNVSPATFKAIPISANGEAQGSDPQILLPVRVFTIYGVPKATVLIAKGGAGLASFLLTLPAAFVLFERVFRKTPKARPRRKRADGPAR
ncbi:hypothetical protein [Caulobacter sp. UNC279MFTsu5.1]|uniref:hypothetical protein n=1 Tax=Caulobacter sp. UNC279MFTsu5.1 TaxID=1502775 RepID=UPI0008EF7A17|nr:hypothetical protein [Caulobacter sp. UNC279MFTsu5.1]SFK60699.1 hypothetical protein SAMN02799626_04711 [Caulobacter sp. UNC279MFTsu5.1]